MFRKLTSWYWVERVDFNVPLKAIIKNGMETKLLQWPKEIFATACFFLYHCIYILCIEEEEKKKEKNQFNDVTF